VGELISTILYRQVFVEGLADVVDLVPIAAQDELVNLIPHVWYLRPIIKIGKSLQHRADNPSYIVLYSRRSDACGKDLEQTGTKGFWCVLANGYFASLTIAVPS
jgi:hypothetical protein